jgi:hypothetical protein
MHTVVVIAHWIANLRLLHGIMQEDIDLSFLHRLCNTISMFQPPHFHMQASCNLYVNPASKLE